MKKTFAVIVAVLVVVILLLFTTTYTVAFNEVAIVTRFGKTQPGDASIQREPGIHFRLPLFADRVTKYDTRMQLLESALETVSTSDQQQVLVKTYLAWKVTDEGAGPLTFHNRLKTIEAATEVLRTTLSSAMRQSLGRFQFSELTAGGAALESGEQAILAELASLSEQGIVPLSVGIVQVQLPAKTTQSVLQNMQAVRQVEAGNERASGMAEANRIQADATTKAEKIRAFANQRAEEIRATGRQQKAKFMEQMARNEELAIFLEWIDALELSFARYTTIVIPTDFEPAHLLSLQKQGDGAIPKPKSSLVPTAKASNSQQSDEELAQGAAASEGGS